MGDFDGASAHKLLNALKNKGTGWNRIFIHTDGLIKILPFGESVFQNSLSGLNNRLAGLTFTGKHGSRIAPEGSRVL